MIGLLTVIHDACIGNGSVLFNVPMWNFPGGTEKNHGNFIRVCLHAKI